MKSRPHSSVDAQLPDSFERPRFVDLRHDRADMSGALRTVKAPRLVHYQGDACRRGDAGVPLHKRRCDLAAPYANYRLALRVHLLTAVNCRF